MFSKPGPATMFADTLAMSADTLAMSYAANIVIAMRLTRMTLGTVDPHREGALMVSEKIDAATEATMAIARSFMGGQPGLAPSRAMAVYNRRVRLNLDRLTQP